MQYDLILPLFKNPAARIANAPQQSFVDKETFRQQELKLFPNPLERQLADNTKPIEMSGSKNRVWDFIRYGNELFIIENNNIAREYLKTKSPLQQENWSKLMTKKYVTYHQLLSVISDSNNSPKRMDRMEKERNEWTEIFDRLSRSRN